MVRAAWPGCGCRCRARPVPRFAGLDFETGVWQNSTMHLPSKLLSSASTLAVLFFLGTIGGFAQNQHPAYLHALTDLRHARAHLQRLDGGRLGAQERDAIRDIEACIDEIKRASIEDGKDLNSHPPVDVKLAFMKAEFVVAPELYWLEIEGGPSVVKEKVFPQSAPWVFVAAKV